MYNFFAVFESTGISYRMGTSRKGLPKLFSEGYGYGFHSAGKSQRGQGYWQCDKSKTNNYCPGRIVLKNNQMIPRGCHSHPPDPSKY